MIKLYAQKNIYILREEMSIFDYKFNLIKKEAVKNVKVYDDNFVDIEQNIAKVYKHNELYHTIELPKKMNNFIINDYFIFSYEKSILTIVSLIGNKVVFNASIAKSEIKKIVLKDELLFVHSEKSIVVLDIIKKKIVFNLAIELDLFDTDGMKIAGFKDGTIYIIDMEKNIDRQKIDIVPNEIRIYKDSVFILKEKELFLMHEELFLVSEECFAFDIKDDFVYSLENKLKKYEISSMQANSIKFLTVDDSTTMRLIIKNSIMNNFENVEVFEAKDGKVALEVLEQNPNINVIFMDWNMPVMDGREAVIKIRENPRYDNIKIIMATTEGGKDKVKEMIEYGVKGYLVKPLKPTSVVPVVEKMIEVVKEERDV